jgi:zinc protease
MRTCLIPLGFILAWAGSSSGQEPKAEPERFRLDNGLSVILRPIEGADETALLVLYGVGGDHDPEGRSGLAHMVEHVYVTAAAGEAPARTAEEYFKRYRAGCNAQTGDRYTVIAAVFARGDLDKELRDAAARMGDLRVTAADLEREKPRIRDEVANMFGRMPSLGAWNNAHELVRPTPRGGRRGGLPEHVQALTLEEVRQYGKRYYKPRNAILVLAGAVDAKAARRAVADHFAKLPAGEKAPAPQEPGAARFGTVRQLVVEPVTPQARPEACLAYAAPAPTSDLYAPFLVHVARLFSSAAKLEAGPGRSPVQYPLLEDPSVLCIAAPAKAGESAKEALARLEKFVASALGPKLGEGEPASAREAFGFSLGVTDVPDRLLARNPYGVALSLARREQLGIDPGKLREALEAVTDEDLRRAAKAIFGPDRHAGAFLSPREK